MITPVLADTTFVDATWVMIVKSLVIFIVILSIVPVVLLAERKLLGRFQQRYGPNRVGPFGALQPLADVGKLLSKQGFRPKGAARARARGAASPRRTQRGTSSSCWRSALCCRQGRTPA